MQVTAQLNNLRISPRKVRLVTRIIKGMDAIVAKHQLDYIIKRSSAPISKLLNSALANAHNNFNLAKENLYIKDILVNEGAKLKRFRPKGFGMVSPIEKKTSHIKIVLEEKVPGLKAEARVKKQELREEKPEVQPVEIIETKSEKTLKTKSDKVKPEIKKEIGLMRAGRQVIAKKSGIFSRVGKIKKFFRRKAI